MMSWEVVWGIVVGIGVSVGGLVGMVWGALAVTDWASRFRKPHDPNLDDEDEIDHRFY